MDTPHDALAPRPGYRFSLGSQADPGWTHYLSVLYPTDEERQRIENRKVLESLERHGDPLTKRRRIDHWMYFERESDVEFVVRALTPLGFEVAERAPDQAGDERSRIMLQVHREDLPDYRSIDDVTMPLFRLARDHGGEYDGWETSVEKEG